MINKTYEEERRIATIFAKNVKKRMEELDLTEWGLGHCVDMTVTDLVEY